LPAASGNAHLITKVSEKELLGTEDATKSDGLVLSEEAAVGYGPDQEIGPRLNIFQVVVSVMLTTRTPVEFSSSRASVATGGVGVGEPVDVTTSDS
jgi:hypothetical protein